MKIGVLTFHRCINYGSYWQSRCMVQALQALGHRAVLLDHRSTRASLAEWRCALRPVLPTPVDAADRRLYARKTRKFFSAFRRLPSSRPFPLEHPELMESFDAVVVGSDEVWNFLHPWYGHEQLFFGEGVRAPRLIAYAASFGNYPFENGLPPGPAALLQRFDSLSVRDDNSRSLLSSMLDRHPELVLDPCLQVLPQRLPDEERGRGIAPRRYLAVYGHNFSRWFAERARDWASQQGMPLVSIGYRNDWCDFQWLTAGPDEFARFMARSSAVATNFFHGCVFALRNGRPFLCEESGYRAIKVRDLLALLGARDRLANAQSSAACCDAQLSTAPADGTWERLAALRASSAAYLARALAPPPHAATPAAARRHDHA